MFNENLNSFQPSKLHSANDVSLKKENIMIRNLININIDDSFEPTQIIITTCGSLYMSSRRLI